MMKAKFDKAPPKLDEPTSTGKQGKGFNWAIVAEVVLAVLLTAIIALAMWGLW
jgi:hypothetical protein